MCVIQRFYNQEDGKQTPGKNQFDTKLEEIPLATDAEKILGIENKN